MNYVQNIKKQIKIQKVVLYIEFTLKIFTYRPSNLFYLVDVFFTIWFFWKRNRA